MRELELRFASGGGRVLAGTLSVPSIGTGPFPAVVTVTGSGAHFRDGNRTPDHPYRPFAQIAADLARRGIACLRLDDRGVGGSSGDAAAATGDDTADDTRAALRFLRARAEIDGRRLGLIGHSFGGEVAPLVAADEPELAALVLMGAPAQCFRETMRYQHRYRIEGDPAIPAARRDAVLADAMAAQERNVATSREAWRRWSQHRDPLATARRVQTPTLILHGLSDRAVPPADAERLAAALRDGGNSRVTVVTFPELNHHFQRDPVGAREGYDRLPTQDLAPEFLETVGLWLSQRFAQSSPPSPANPR